MIQLFGQSVALDGSPAEEIASLPARRRTAGLGHALEARWRLALECAAVFAELAIVSGQDVLASALHRLTGFRRAGESEQAAAQRLERALEVTRLGPAYQFSIRA